MVTGPGSVAEPHKAADEILIHHKQLSANYSSKKHPSLPGEPEGNLASRSLQKDISAVGLTCEVE